MTDRILLQNLRFEATHGYHDYEQRNPQPFEVDVELRLNLQPAGIDDDLTRTIDYGRVYAIVQRVMESTTFRLLEALAEAIIHSSRSRRQPSRSRRQPPRSRRRPPRSRRQLSRSRQPSSSADRWTTPVSRSGAGAREVHDITCRKQAARRKDAGGPFGRCRNRLPLLGA